jgi:hypothetical protein
MKEQLNKILTVTKEKLDALWMGSHKDHNLYHDTSYYSDRSGKEHYRLLTFVSSLYQGCTIFDVGTNKCMSALALSSNKSNRVKSYDVVRFLPYNPTISNVEFVIGNATEDTDLTSSPVIFLDVNHDGLYEKEFYDHLKKISYRGILLLDDINLNDPMKEYWNGFTERKYDLTHIGHWSGTGLVVFE